MTAADADRGRGPARPGDGAVIPPYFAEAIDVLDYEVDNFERDGEFVLARGFKAAIGVLKRVGEVRQQRVALAATAPPAAPGAAAATLDEMAERLRLAIRERADGKPTLDTYRRLVIATLGDAPPGSAFPGAEAVAEALWETERERLGEASWTRITARTGEAAIVAQEVLAPYRSRATAVLARLAATKTDGAALPVTLDAASLVGSAIEAARAAQGPHTIVQASVDVPAGWTTKTDSAGDTFLSAPDGWLSAEMEATKDAPAGPGLAGAVRDAAPNADRSYEPSDDEVEAASKALFDHSDFALGDPRATMVGPNDFKDDARAALKAAHSVRAVAALDGGADGGFRDESTAPVGKMLVTYRLGEDDVTRAALRVWPDGEREWTAPDGRTTVTHHSYAPPTHWLCEAPDLPAPPRSGQRGGDDAQG